MLLQRGVFSSQPAEERVSQSCTENCMVQAVGPADVEKEQGATSRYGRQILPHIALHFQAQAMDQREQSLARLQASHRTARQ